VPCRLHVQGQPCDLAPEARLAIYRATQEALTNIRKHADATSVDVDLRYTPRGTELTIENQGAAHPSSIESGGYGLSGMRERAELLGGTVEAGPTESGFRVCLRLPR
jgi:signal transduction histidine kinase